VNRALLFFVSILAAPSEKRKRIKSKVLVLVLLSLLLVGFLSAKAREGLKIKKRKQ
jgi:hypothetical protein